MRTALVALVSVALGALAAVGVTAWEPWDGNGENADDAGEAEELSLTLDAEDAASFAAAADRLETLLPDFDCSGGWDDRERPLGSGALECAAGSAGFDCTFWPVDPLRSLGCHEKDQPPAGFPFCRVERAGGAVAPDLVFCSGPSTRTLCRVHRATSDGQNGESHISFKLTCQRS